MYVRYLFDASMGFDPVFLPFASVYTKSYSADYHMCKCYVHSCTRHNLVDSEDSVSESFDCLSDLPYLILSFDSYGWFFLNHICRWSF